MMPMTQQNKPYFCLQHFQDSHWDLIFCLHPSPTSNCHKFCKHQWTPFLQGTWFPAHHLDEILFPILMLMYVLWSMSYIQATMRNTKYLCFKSIMQKSTNWRSMKTIRFTELQKNFSNIITWHYCLFFKLENSMMLDTHHDICCFHLPNEVEHQAHSSRKSTGFAHL